MAARPAYLKVLDDYPPIREDETTMDWVERVGASPEAFDAMLDLRLAGALVRRMREVQESESSSARDSTSSPEAGIPTPNRGKFL